MSGRPPDLYRENPFRVLSIPITATAADIRRRGRELQLRATLAGTESDAAEAAARLDDAVLRLEAELYWRWLPDEAAEALERRAAGGSEVAAHDLAVLHHAAALDSPRSAGERWSAALGAWADTWGSERFWERMRERAAALQDPRATGAAVDRLRAQLPGRVLTATAVAAADLLAEAADGPAAEALAAVAASALPAGNDQRAHALALEGLVRQVGDLLADPGSAGAMLAAASRLRALEPLSPAAERVLDDAADHLRHRALALWRERHDLLGGRPLLDSAVALATSAVVRGRATALMAEWDRALDQPRRQLAVAGRPAIRLPRSLMSGLVFLALAAAAVPLGLLGIGICTSLAAPRPAPVPTFAAPAVPRQPALPTAFPSFSPPITPLATTPAP
jgi:hypothetical protein